MTSHKLFDTLAKRYCDTLASEIENQIKKIKTMKSLTKKETLERKKAKAMKDLAGGLDSLANFLSTEFKKTQAEIEQYKHGLSSKNQK